MSAPTMLPPITEPSAWCRATGAAQARRAERMMGDLSGATGPLVIAPLVGRLTEHGTEADRTCDRCGRYVPPGEDYVAGVYRPRPRLVLVLGLCVEHARAEGVRHADLD